MQKHRITHHIIENSCSLDFFLEQEGFDVEEFHRLLSLGAVYLNKKRIDSLSSLEKNDYLRIHHDPRRFADSQEISIIYEDEEFVAIDKPPGLPSHPTLDNSLENAKNLLEIKLRAALHLPHRLDINTSGVLLFCKTVNSQNQFTALLKDNLVKKKYLARSSYSAEGIQTGPLIHYMEPSKRCPKQVSRQPKDSWKTCQLLIEDIENCHDKTLISILLITGRTHQIRAQLSAIGMPIDGDQLYGSTFDCHGKASAKPLWQQHLEPIALRCYGLSFSDIHIKVEKGKFF